MVSVVSLNEKTEENNRLKCTLRDLAAKLTDEYWELNFFETTGAFCEFVKAHPLIDFSCVDFSTQDAPGALMSFRRQYNEALLLLIAETGVPPTRYLRPGIRADSLLLRPFSDEEAKESLTDLLDVYLDQGKDDDAENIFLIEDKDNTWRIPYADIFYFETKEKKVFARTKNDEYGFYDTLDHLQSRLPEDFVRCHRSFIINANKLIGVYLSNNYVELADGFEIPLSRSYKARIREYR
ncbi:MAG: LytTR family transcriptional regulator DNA-binding domain-containing protein [Lachnospiraceae bacterium]|nr:LytTR family transcriptional regulator DNA-binding domain-containing protein [Lachnospiraceae bacterium]